MGFFKNGQTKTTKARNEELDNKTIRNVRG